ncbi:ORF68 [Ictalurid herpesvirus 1]|nr:ORF68 [Ictalurid herpesvirus 1]
MLRTIGSHLDFSDNGIIKCIQQGCTFSVISAGINQCPIHFTVHVCHAVRNGTCEQLKRKIAVLLGESSPQFCFFDNGRADPEVEPVRGITGKIIAGLDQKFKEAIVFGHGGDYNPTPNLTHKITKYHMLRKRFVIDALAPLVSFHNVIDIIQRSNSVTRQDRTKYRQIWETIEEGALSHNVEQEVCRYVKIISSFLYHADLRVLLMTYNKIKNSRHASDDLRDFYLVPFLCIHKLITDKHRTTDLLINFLFKKSESVNQRMFTQFNKVLHRIYDAKLVKDICYVAWGSEIITALEALNVHIG